MLTLTPTKTLSPPPLPSGHQNPSPKSSFGTQFPRSRRRIGAPSCNSQLHTERGLEFETGDTFFRHESATGRDLGVLAASLYRQSTGRLRVLDAMCGCGVRSLRYLAEAEADFVLANDANDDCRSLIVGNLSSVSEGEGRWVVESNDATRVMTESYLRRDFFDLVDLDSFGSESSFLRPAFNCLKLGGLIYATSTDGYSSGGHRPHHSLDAYGAFVRPMPYSNEIGLRMLIGGVIREASVLGYRVKPLFSYYSYHGPVFRVMFQVNRGKLPENRHYGFTSYCNRCGNSHSYTWHELGRMRCPCSDAKESSSLVVSGPLWIGPLHCASYITDMLKLAEQRGWVGNGRGPDLEKLLLLMLDESDPRLPVGYIKLDKVASRAKVNSPPLRIMMSALQKEGYAVSRSHIVSNAIKTNSSMANCIEIVKRLQQC